MSGQIRARRRALQAINDGPLTPLGSCKAQPSGGTSIYINYPKEQARAYSITPGTEFDLFNEPRTGTLIAVPSHNLEELESL